MIISQAFNYSQVGFFCLNTQTSIAVTSAGVEPGRAGPFLFSAILINKPDQKLGGGGGRKKRVQNGRLAGDGQISVSTPVQRQHKGSAGLSPKTQFPRRMMRISHTAENTFKNLVNADMRKCKNSDEL